MAKTNFQYEKRQKDLEKKRKKEEKLKKKADKATQPDGSQIDSDDETGEIESGADTANTTDDAEEPKSASNSDTPAV